MKFLDKLQYKYGRFAIYNLMSYIVGGMAMVYIADFVLSMSAGRR
jgi:hypothetical protein